MYFAFALVALLCWSGSDLFSKMGTSQKDKQSHWRVVFAVGAIMGIHAILTLIISPFLPADTPEWLKTIIYTDFKPIDFINYLPVASIYIIAMVFGYVGLRYIELSVSSPICNSSGSLALLICCLLGWATLTTETIIGVVLITLGIVGLGITDYRENQEAKLARQDKSQFKYTKSLVAILIPIIYLFLDALGTVGDQMVSELSLFEMSDYASNTAFEFAFVLFAIFAFVWVKFVKKEKFFTLPEDTVLDEKSLPSAEDNVSKEVTTRKISRKTALLLGSICETVGQMFYMAVMFSDFDAGMPMISAYCVLSVVWSRIFLKEKLSWLHYTCIALTFIGIILLGIFSPV